MHMLPKDEKLISLDLIVNEDRVLLSDKTRITDLSPLCTIKNNQQ